ncbi:MAG: hypothetical protein ABW185_23020 [Sedimenticola sp.]
MGEEGEAMAAARIPKPIVMPDCFYGGDEEDWECWYQNFTDCAEINGWDDDLKLKFLAVRMKGMAQRVFMDLDSESKGDFSDASGALAVRFRSTKDKELFKSQFLSRNRQAGETLPSLGNAIRVLAGKAYTEVASKVRDELARDQFIRALNNSKLVLELRHHMPKSLDDAIRVAIEWENVEGTGSKLTAATGGLGEAAGSHLPSHRSGGPNSGSRDELVEMMKEMMTLFKSERGGSAGGRGFERGAFVGGRGRRGRGRPIERKDEICWQCGQGGHMRRECPNFSCWQCGAQGHRQFECPHKNSTNSGNGM